MMIWKRYLIKLFLKTFFGVLLGFYLLYVLIDYTNQMGAFRHQEIKITFLQWSQYYLFEFLHRADILIPFALLLATMRTLLSLNSRNELVALQCGGLSTKKLLQPFLAIGLICTMLLYINEEYFIPRSLAQVKFLQQVKKNKPLKKHEFMIQSFMLDDGTFILYQTYEPFLDRFFDVYWVRSVDSIMKMRYLYPNAQPQFAEYMELLVRDPQGNIALSESAEKYILKDLVINKEKLRQAAAVPELQALTQLWESLPQMKTTLSPREAQIRTAFYQKMTLPLLSLIVVLFASPFCLRFNRNLSPFIFYAIGTFSFIAFYLFLDALAVLARRQLMDPAFLTVTPIACTLLISLFRYK